MEGAQGKGEGAEVSTSASTTYIRTHANPRPKTDVLWEFRRMLVVLVVLEVLPEPMPLAVLEGDTTSGARSSGVGSASSSAGSIGGSNGTSTSNDKSYQ
jgi:hypothetical protein